MINLNRSNSPILLGLALLTVAFTSAGLFLKARPGETVPVATQSGYAGDPAPAAVPSLTRDAEIEVLQDQLTAARNRIAALNEEIAELELRAEPDFDRLKERALQALGNDRDAWLSASPTAPVALARLSDAQLQARDYRYSQEGLRLDYGFLLDNLNIDATVTDSIVEDLQALRSYNDSLDEQLQAGEINPNERRALVDEAVEQVWRNNLNEAQLAQYQDLKQAQTTASLQASAMSELRATAGLVSAESEQLLFETYTAMHEARAAQLHETPAQEYAYIVDQLLAMKDWVTRSLPAQDQIPALSALESNLVLRERSFASQQRSFDDQVR